MTIFAAILATALAQVPADADAPHGAGRAVYVQYCASCHGVDLRGGKRAPTLLGAGAAGADFYVTTGRMPAAVPWLEVGHRGQQPYLTPLQQDAVVRYVASVAPGPPIPIVVTNGDAVRGRTLFEQNCMHCHGVDARGGAIGRGDWAPALDRATVTQVAEAIRIGPGQMPRFGPHQIDAASLDDIATYLTERRDTTDFAELPVRAGGTVPEGLYGWIAAGSLAFFAFVFWSADEREQHDA
jgi:ubiquinol-cytochrome c reductase cytochrome c subunit